MVYHLGGVPFSQAGLIINGANAVSAISAVPETVAGTEPGLPLISIQEGNRVELGGRVGSEALQKGDSIWHLPTFVVRGSEDLTNLLGISPSGHNHIALTLSGDREAVLERVYQKLEGDEAKAAQTAHDRQIKSVLKMIPPSEDPLRAFLDAVLNQNSEETAIHFAEGLSITRSNRSDGELAVFVAGTQESLGRFLETYWQVRQFPFEPGDGLNLVGEAIRGTFAEPIGIGRPLTQTDFAAMAAVMDESQFPKPDPEAFERAVTELQTQWRVSKGLAEFMASQRAAFPFDLELREEVEKLAAHLGEAGPELLQLYDEGLLDLGNKIELVRSDGTRQGTHKNFGHMLDPLHFPHQVLEALAHHPSYLSRLSWVLPEIEPLRVTLPFTMRLIQHDFFSGSPAFLAIHLKSLEDVSVLAAVIQKLSKKELGIAGAESPAAQEPAAPDLADRLLDNPYEFAVALDAASDAELVSQYFRIREYSRALILALGPARSQAWGLLVLEEELRQVEAEIFSGRREELESLKNVLLHFAGRLQQIPKSAFQKSDFLKDTVESRIAALQKLPATALLESPLEFLEVVHSMELEDLLLTVREVKDVVHAMLQALVKEEMKELAEESLMDFLMATRIALDKSLPESEEFHPLPLKHCLTFLGGKLNDLPRADYLKIMAAAKNILGLESSFGENLLSDTGAFLEALEQVSDEALQRALPDIRSQMDSFMVAMGVVGVYAWGLAYPRLELSGNPKNPRKLLQMFGERLLKIPEEKYAEVMGKLDSVGAVSSGAPYDIAAFREHIVSISKVPAEILLDDPQAFEKMVGEMSYEDLSVTLGGMVQTTNAFLVLMARSSLSDHPVIYQGFARFLSEALEAVCEVGLIQNETFDPWQLREKLRALAIAYRRMPPEFFKMLSGYLKNKVRKNELGGVDFDLEHLIGDDFAPIAERGLAYIERVSVRIDRSQLAVDPRDRN